MGHRGKFGHEFMEFELQPNGKLRYANNSNYKNDVMIRKEGYLSHAYLLGNSCICYPRRSNCEPSGYEGIQKNYTRE